ncbi:MAG: M48 family metallopeptidase [Victivallaceae bacterium]|nr:M48 family metallopeptidase [Victivallaceae bacterium]
MNKSFLAMTAVSMVFSAALLSTGCRSVPMTDRSQLMLTSSAYENRLGAESYAEYKKQFRQSSNAEYNAALARVGAAVKAAAPENDFEWEFVVFDSATQNAFCLPGGKVAVYSGLIDRMNNEAELACVVSHEVAHAIARHSGERMSWSQLRTLGAIGLDLGLDNNAVNEIYGTGTEIGVMLPFSRSNEAEADQIGQLLMARAGYDPRASIQFWTRFSEGKSASTLGALLSTHPCDADRIAALNASLPTAAAVYNHAAVRRGFGTVFTR